MAQSVTEHKRIADRAARRKQFVSNKPARRRPKSIQEEADQFVTAALAHFDKEGIVLNKKNLGLLPVLFRNYSANTGLRGDEKRKVWKKVEDQLREAKASVTDENQEL